MREAVGDTIDIMVDCHARPSPRMGLLFAKALEPYGLYLFEEPCWPESVEGSPRSSMPCRRRLPRANAWWLSKAFPRLLETARLQHLAARHHALRRPERSAADRGHGRGLSRGYGSAQSARAGQHGGVAGVGLRHAELHDLRGGACGRAVAAGRRAAKDLPSRTAGPVRETRRARRAWASRSTRRKCGNIPSSRRSCSASSTPTAAWPIGKYAGKQPTADAWAASCNTVEPQLSTQSSI